jgi:hypothetical protein
VLPFCSFDAATLAQTVPGHKGVGQVHSRTKATIAVDHDHG